MTTHAAPTARINTTAAVATSPAGSAPGLRLAAGLALIAFPLLYAAGMATAPPQASDSARDYVASLGADPWLTGLSAGLLHYSWVAFALGVLGIIGLVRGRRGRVFVPLAAVVTSFSAMQLSGLLLSDWFVGAAVDTAGPDQATTIFETVNADPWVSTWLVSGRLVGLLGIPLVVAALARAGVVSWWLLLAPVVGVACLVVPVPGALVVSMFVGSAPMIVVGVRLIQRASARVRREELAAA